MVINASGLSIEISKSHTKDGDGFFGDLMGVQRGGDVGSTDLRMPRPNSECFQIKTFSFNWKYPPLLPINNVHSSPNRLALSLLMFC
jgi:hypothetical protein